MSKEEGDVHPIFPSLPDLMTIRSGILGLQEIALIMPIDGKIFNNQRGRKKQNHDNPVEVPIMW